MGSIGQYAGVKDYIYNAHIENVTMLNAQVRLQPKALFNENNNLSRTAHVLNPGPVQT